MDQPNDVNYTLLLFSRRGVLLCNAGAFTSEDAALKAVASAVLGLPSSGSWKIIKTTKTVVHSGDGFPTHHPTMPGPSCRVHS